MNFLNMRLPVKIIAGYLIGCVFVTILFSVSIFHISTITNDYNNLVKNSWRQLNALQDVRASIMQIELDQGKDQGSVPLELRRLDSSVSTYLQLGQNSFSNDLAEFMRDYVTFRRAAAGLIGPKSKQLGGHDHGGRQDYQKSYLLFLGETMVELQKGLANTSVSEMNYLIRVQQLLLINVILSPLNFLFLYFYGFAISNYLATRLKKFLDKLNVLLAGRYRERIEDDSADELGVIAAGINELAARLEKSPGS